jgi:hypothetical protein
LLNVGEGVGLGTGSDGSRVGVGTGSDGLVGLGNGVGVGVALSVGAGEAGTPGVGVRVGAGRTSVDRFPENPDAINPDIKNRMTAVSVIVFLSMCTSLLLRRYPAIVMPARFI